MQRHWLGKSSGAKIKFGVSTLDSSFDVEVFTTRADTLHGVQYLALSMNHPLVRKPFAGIAVPVLPIIVSGSASSFAERAVP